MDLDLRARGESQCTMTYSTWQFVFTHRFSSSQSISIASCFSNELLGVTEELLWGGCPCSWVFCFYFCCLSGGKGLWNGLVHLLCAITTERKYFFLPWVVSLLWWWEAKGCEALVCVLVGGTAEPRWCVGMSNIYIKNRQGNSLIGSERSSSCSCKVLKLSLCLLLLQMFLWVCLSP